MKRAEIRTELEAHLLALGFRRGQWLWTPQIAQLAVLVNQEFRTVTLKSGISRRAMTYEMGRIAGWAEMAGIEPAPKHGRRLNGTAPHAEATPPA